MNYKILLLIASISLFFSNCNNDDNVQGFEMTYVRSFEIFAGLNTFETHVFQLTNFDADFETFLNSNGTTRADVVEVIPKAFRITNLTGNITFEDLQRIRLFITKTDGTLEREIAFLEIVPLDVGFQVDLVPTLAEVTEIMDSGDFHLELKLNYRSIPPQTIDARINVIFQAVTQ